MTKKQGSTTISRAEFDIMYGKGISKVGEIVDVGLPTWISSPRVALGIATKIPNWPKVVRRLSSLLRKI